MTEIFFSSDFYCGTEMVISRFMGFPGQVEFLIFASLPIFIY
jgi:hypothetical protein